MTELQTTMADRPKRRNGAAHAPVVVSGDKPAVHFGCSRQNVDQLTAQGVIERRVDLAAAGVVDEEHAGDREAAEDVEGEEALGLGGGGERGLSEGRGGGFGCRLSEGECVHGGYR